MTKSAWILVGIGSVLVVGGVGFGVWRVTHRTDDQPTSSAVSSNVSSGTQRGSGRGRNGGGQSSGSATWSFTGSAWQASGTPPSCSNPILPKLPVDLANVTTILYPGQTRGGQYKPHGGFRFDKATTNDVAVSAPIDAQLVDGSRYLVGGETQYTLDFISACGIHYRLGHLLTLTSQFQAIVDTFPPAQEMDSRTTFVQPSIPVPAGTAIATQTGVTHDSLTGRNVFMDFGVYDLRAKNAASADAAWQAKHTDDQELAPYAVCWLNADVVGAEMSAKLKAFPPSDPTSGTTSDYCK